LRLGDGGSASRSTTVPRHQESGGGKMTLTGQDRGHSEPGHDKHAKSPGSHYAQRPTIRSMQQPSHDRKDDNRNQNHDPPRRAERFEQWNMLVRYRWTGSSLPTENRKASRPTAYGSNRAAGGLLTAKARGSMAASRNKADRQTPHARPREEAKRNWPTRLAANRHIPKSKRSQYCPRGLGWF